MAGSGWRLQGIDVPVAFPGHRGCLVVADHARVIGHASVQDSEGTILKEGLIDSCCVIPAHAGIQKQIENKHLDSGCNFNRNDELISFLKRVM